MTEGSGEINQQTIVAHAIKEGAAVTQDLTDFAVHLPKPPPMDEQTRAIYQEKFDDTDEKRRMSEIVTIARSIQDSDAREKAFIEIVQGYALLAKNGDTNNIDYEIEALNVLDQIPINGPSRFHHVEALAKFAHLTDNREAIKKAKLLANDKDWAKQLADIDPQRPGMPLSWISKPLRADALCLVGKYTGDEGAINDAHVLYGAGGKAKKLFAFAEGGNINRYYALDSEIRAWHDTKHFFYEEAEEIEPQFKQFKEALSNKGFDIAQINSLPYEERSKEYRNACLSVNMDTSRYDAGEVDIIDDTLKKVNALHPSNDLGKDT